MLVILSTIFFINFIFSDFDNLFKPELKFIAIGLVVGLGINYINFEEPTEMTITTETTKIYSLKNSTPNISGSFFLGSGVIETKPMYSMFVDGLEGSSVKYFVTSGAFIYEVDDNNSRHEHITCNRKSYFSYFLGSTVSVVKSCEFDEMDKLFVPKGTITNKFSI